MRVYLAIVVASVGLLCGAHALAADSSSSVTSSTAVQAGNSAAMNMNGAGGSNNLTIAPGQSQAQLPMTNQQQVPSSNIYGPLGATPGSASVPFIAAANKLCNVRYTRQFMPKATSSDDTESKRTRLVLNQFPTLLAQARSSILVDEVVPPNLSGSVYSKVKCLGTLTMWTKEAAGNSTDFGVVESDAMNYIFENFRGYGKIALVSLIQSVSAASGVSTGGWSAGIGGALGHIVSALTSAGIAPSFSVGSGKTNPTNFPGGTFLVLALEQDDGQTINTADLLQHLAPPRQ